MVTYPAMHFKSSVLSNTIGRESRKNACCVLTGSIFIIESTRRETK